MQCSKMTKENTNISGTMQRGKLEGKSKKTVIITFLYLFIFNCRQWDQIHLMSCFQSNLWVCK